MHRTNDYPTRILIADWFPSLNKGELAILFGTLKTFEVLGKVEVSTFSFLPQQDKERYPQNVKIIDVRSDLHLGTSPLKKPNRGIIPTALFSMLQHIFFSMLYAVIGDNAMTIMNKSIWREYLRSDVIIICHDQENCVFGPSLLLFFPMYITLLAKILGKPIVIYANGTYKSKNRLWRILARYLLNNVDLITIREEESFKYLKSIAGNKAPIYLTADPAILLSPVDEVRYITKEEGIEKGDDLLIGVTLTRSLLLSTYLEFRNPENSYGKALAAFAKLFDRLIDSINAKIIFIPHCIEPYHLHRRNDDRDVAKEVFNLMQNKHKVVLLTKEYTPQELKGLMNIFDLFVGSRVHSVVNALCMGVPSITLTTSSSYMRPCGIIGGTLNQKEWIYIIDHLEPEKLFSRIIDLLSLREEIRKNLVLETERAKKKALLNGKLLKVLLDSRIKRDC